MSINSSLGRRPSRPPHRSRYRRRDQETYNLEAFKHLRNLVIALGIYLVLYGCVVLPWSFGDRVQDLLDRTFSINYDWDTVKEQAVKVSSWRPGAIWPLSKKNPNTAVILEPPLSGQITSAFGARQNPLTKVAEQHTGVDLEGKVGTVISAAGDGVVVSVGEERGYGNCIRIDHGEGIITLYAHLLRTAVEPNELVTRGQTIGWVGNSGTSLGYHLHLEVLENGEPVDPTKWIKLK